MAQLWSNNESIHEWKPKLVCTNQALESTKEKPTRQVYQLWQTACLERDEGKDQLQKVVVKNFELEKLLDGFLTSKSSTTSLPAPKIEPENSPVNVTDSSINVPEPNYIADIFRKYSHVASPQDYISYETLSLPLSNSNVSDSSNSGLLQQPFVQYSNGCIQMSSVSSKKIVFDHISGVLDTSHTGNSLPDNSLVAINNPVKGKSPLDFTKSAQIPTISSTNATPDYASMLIDNLAKQRQLPEKGKLVQAVIEAGPLLETLLVSIPIPPVPKWRNPPHLSLLLKSFYCNADDDHAPVNPKAIFDPNPAIPIPSSSVQNLGLLSQVAAGCLEEGRIEKRRRLQQKQKSLFP